MGFWPFAWSWKTKRGGRIFVGGIVITPALVGLNWFLNRGQHQQQLPALPQERWVEKEEKRHEGD